MAEGQPCALNHQTADDVVANKAFGVILATNQTNENKRNVLKGQVVNRQSSPFSLISLQATFCPFPLLRPMCERRLVVVVVVQVTKVRSALLCSVYLALLCFALICSALSCLALLCFLLVFVFLLSRLVLLAVPARPAGRGGRCQCRTAQRPCAGAAAARSGAGSSGTARHAATASRCRPASYRGET